MFGRFDECAIIEPAACAFSKNKCHTTKANRFCFDSFFDNVRLFWKTQNVLLKGGNGFLLADKEYGDFVFECDWKALNTSKWNSGVSVCSLGEGGASEHPRHLACANDARKEGSER